MRILVLNQDWFVEELRAAGHEVVTAGPNSALDRPLNVPLIHIDTICHKALNGFEPDVLLIHDNSQPILVDGLAERSLPIVFYSIDVHHHADFHVYLWRAVDYMFVAQPDYLPSFKGSQTPPEWMPLWAPRLIEPQPEKDLGAVFVGTLNRALNPERVDFFEALEQEAPIVVKQGRYDEFFPRAQIVINQTVKGDLNFRVYEAMMCGAMLLTEESNNGLYELFEPGVHLVTYPKGDVRAAAQLIRHYLDNPEKAATIAAAGRERILEKHCSHHRAERVEAILREVEPTVGPMRNLGWLVNYHATYRRVRSESPGIANRALIAALKVIDRALSAGEPLNAECACAIVHCCIEYDRVFKSDAGHRLVLRGAQADCESPLLKLAALRGALNHGDLQNANAIASEFGAENSQALFAEAEKLVLSVLEQFENEA